MYLKNGKIELCCGCRACEQICPQRCIKMQADEEGFLYPQINNDLCTGCNLCIKCCPIVEQSQSDQIIKQQFNPASAYAFYHLNDEVRIQSTSGGAFTAFVEAICDQNYVIFGARFDESFKVFHSYTNNKKELSIFRKSKYVQSDLGNSYTNAKKFLIEGKKVLFSGTPCQIAGLKAFLKKDYENLFCIDVICHGVPSPKVFKKYKEYLECKKQSKIKKFDFRNKRRAGWSASEIVALFDNRKSYSRFSLRVDEDIYMFSFLSYLCLRPICHTCPYATTLRTSDITIGDFWGVEKIDPDLYDEKGVSLVLVNSEKGKNALEKCKEIAYYKSMELSSAVKYNTQLSKPAERNPLRDAFMTDMQTMNFSQLEKKYFTPRFFMKRMAAKYLNKETKKLIKKILAKSGVVCN